MLVHYRTKMVWNGTDNYKIENAETEIIKDAHVTLSKPKRIGMWREMEQDGLISFGIGKEAKKITLHYISNPTEYENSNAIEIEDFDDFYIYYEAYSKNQKIKECQECGKSFLFKSKTYSPKYCETCAKKIKNKQVEDSKKRKKDSL